MRGNPSCPLSERCLEGDRRLDRAPPEGRETSDVVGKHLLAGRVPWISSADDPIPTFSATAIYPRPVETILMMLVLVLSC
jgi:hypothetical protein